MIKNIIKEIGISIMLLIAIALILSIIFYEYIPNNKTVPIAVKPYAISEDVQEELNESINQEEQNIVITRHISDDELNVYESNKSYNKGKANPFADYSNDKDNSNQVNDNKTSNNTSTSKNTTNENVTENKTGDSAENNTRNESYVSTPGKN